MKPKTKESKEPVDLGVNVKCNVCDKRLCTCKDRLSSGGFKVLKRKHEHFWQYDGEYIQPNREVYPGEINVFRFVCECGKSKIVLQK